MHHLWKIQTRPLDQNAAARLVSGASQCDHITPVLCELHWLPVRQRIHFKLGCLMYKSVSEQVHQAWGTTFSLSLTADDAGCDLPVTEPVSFHGMLYLQNYKTTSALDLGANWSRICLSRALNHGALWHIVFLRLRNNLTYLLLPCH